VDEEFVKKKAIELLDLNLEKYKKKMDERNVNKSVRYKITEIFKNLEKNIKGSFKRNLI